jgi:hypothetical protein
MKILRIIFSLLLLPFSLFSQDWLRYYGNGQQPQAYYCIEQYDRGYIISGAIDHVKYGWLVKTDINGNQLWDIKIGNGLGLTGISNIEQTYDNGFILCGSTTMYNYPANDPFIMKLNYCGELMWCNVLLYDNTSDDGISVKQTVDGGFVMLGAFYGNDPNNRVRLFKFDSGGNLIWYKIYNRDPDLNNEDIRSLVADTAAFLITGSAYTPSWHRPYYIQTDTAGNENWRLVYSQHTGYGFVGMALNSARDKYGNYYSVGYREEFAELMKFSGDGYEISNFDFFPSAQVGTAATIHMQNDTSLIIGISWVINGSDNLAMLKTDTLGNTVKQKDLPNPNSSGMTWSQKTFDNKIIVAGTDYQGANSRMELFKFNYDLEYDSIYTRHFTYDSLCPHPIVSDTIVPDCGILVNVDEPFANPESVALKVFPNPAGSRVTVEFPKHLVVKNGNSSFGSTTIYDKWKSTMLEVYDLSGKKIFEKEVVRAQNTLELDVSKWQSGMYYFRLVFNDRKVGEAKVVVE